MIEMPELPEVETIVRTLRPKLAGLTFTGANVTLEKIISQPAPVSLFTEQITGKRILQINRRGKYLLFSLSDGLCLLFHLRMTGNLLYRQEDQPIDKYTHLILYLDNRFQLRYADMRQFGRIWLQPAASLPELTGFAGLGIEPLDDAFTNRYLSNKLSQRHSRIKPLLLDQTFIAGLGNIYADEALFRAGINPETHGSDISELMAADLHHSIREVLQEGIANRGTTIRDYKDGDGLAGKNQDSLRVYGKEGKPCQRCGNAIVRKKIGGRSSFFCPNCQVGRE